MTLERRRVVRLPKVVVVVITLFLAILIYASSVGGADNNNNGRKNAMNGKKKNTGSQKDYSVSKNNMPPRCVPEFPLTSEWLGGDAATSIPILQSSSNRRWQPRRGKKKQEQQRTLWLFGDTFVAREPGQTTRIDSFFLYNTIAHSTCSSNGEWEIEYSWRHNKNGTPATVLVPTDGVGFYWPVAGSAIDNTPYVIVERIRLEGGFFETIGVDVARIANPEDHPDDWNVKYSKLTGSLGEETPSSASIVDGTYFYVLGYLAQPIGRPRYMSRIALDVMNSFPPNLGEFLEVYTGPTTGWQVGGTPYIIMDDFATEMGLQRLPEDCGYITTTLLPIQTGETEVSRRIYVRTARKLEGPWSERRLIATVPDLDKDYANGFVNNTICYAAKLHPQLTSPANLLYTYVCNIANFASEVETRVVSMTERLTQPRGQLLARARGEPSDIPPGIFTAMNVYIPRPVTVSMPTPQDMNGLDSECPWLIDVD